MMPPNTVGLKMEDPNNFSLVQFDYPISEKGSKFKSTKQLTWLLVLRVQRVTSTVSNSIKILKHRTFFKKWEGATRRSSKILTFLKIIFALSFFTLLFEVYAHWKQWNLAHMMIRPHEVTNIAHIVYLRWLSIRADYIAPFIVYLSRFCIVLFLVQSIDRFVQCVGCFWIKCRRLKPVLPKNAGSYYPMVLVQIPMCNEKEVYEQSISAACNLDWPRDRLLIQVLDDSDNKLVQILIKNEVSRWKQKGANIIYRHRYYRTGYKAGNLSSAMACDYVRDYEFVALFDADFKPNPDFLKKTVPHFKDNPQLALVQARWSFINKEENLLTRLQHINLAFHFEVEQQVNGIFLNFFGFNGTAGVWRIKALEDSGGWLERTTVEDMDIAVRAHLKGWKFIFLNDVKVLCEVPESYKAYKKQQHRWHSGPMQLFRLCLPSIISSKISVWKKMNLIFLFFLLRKLILPFYSFTLFCIILPLTMFIPEAELPVWVICYVPVFISMLNVLPSPKSFPFIIPYLMFENTMSVTKFNAMISGLFQLGSSYEWEVTKKTGRSSDTDLLETRKKAIEKSISESDIELGDAEDEKEQKANKKRNRIFKNELFLACLLLTAAARSLLSAQGVHFYFLLFQGLSFLVVGLDLIGEQV